jgi:hypothetical protein
MQTLTTMQKTIFASLLTLALLAGCSSNPPQKQEAAKPSTPAKAPAAKEAQYLTGREAFQKLYIAARNWSPDAQPLKMESSPRSDDKHDGTAAVWNGSFASAQRGQLRSFMWSGAVGEGAPEPGITPGSQDTYTAANASTQPFDIAYLKADTDEALKVADSRGPASIKKLKDKPVKFQLFNDSSRGRLLWRVIYGTSEYSAKAVVDISARDGGFVKVEK